MESFIADVRPYAEIVHFLTSIGLAAIAFYGLRQIHLFKADMIARSERAAKEKAIEASAEYLNAFCALDGVFLDECIQKNLSSYKGQVGNFTPDSISDAFRPFALARFATHSWLPAINKLESIAAMFVTGVADEQVGFEIIGRTFCATVSLQYDLISLSRREQNNPHFNNIVKLYTIWSPRLSKAELEASRTALDKQISAISDTKIPPLKPNV